MSSLQSYISGNALVILGGPHDLLQTIYHDGTTDLDAVAIDEATGKIATSSGHVVYIYSPQGSDRGALKVPQLGSFGKRRLTSWAVVSTSYSYPQGRETGSLHIIMGSVGGIAGRIILVEALRDRARGFYDLGQKDLKSCQICTFLI